MVPRVSATVTIQKPSLQTLFDNLRQSGFRLVGPVVRDAAIVLDEINSIEELPIGMTDDQGASRYRIRHANSELYFDFNVAADSWKRFLFPPRMKLFSVEKKNGSIRFLPADHGEPPVAAIGVRACDIHALSILDRVFVGGSYADPTYVERRQKMFTLAVNCSKATPNCFCSSMKTGPRSSSGFDLALTELPTAFVIEVGSEAGSEALRDSGWTATTAFDQGRANQVMQQAERQVVRNMKTDDLPRLLFENLEHNRWKDVASRCMSCGNCTMVCPTCFCSTVTDTIDLTATKSDRIRIWDSCYSADFSHVHGGNLRPTVRSRYRQWLTHKFASWQEQFGVFGCVGCGRCLTWCPAGIDLTEEVGAIRGAEVTR